MENGQQRTARLVNDRALTGRVTINRIHTRMFLLPQSARAALANAAPTPLMHNKKDSASLNQQILRIASIGSESSVVLAEIAALLGEAFQADACLLTLTDVEAACWVSKPQSLLVQDLQYDSATLQKELDTFEPLAIANLGAVPPTLTHDPPAKTWTEFWNSITLSGKSLQARAALGIAIQFPESRNVSISLFQFHPRRWTKLDIEQLRSTTQHVAIALSQVRLQQQLSRRTQYQTIVNQLTIAIHNASDLNEILQLATADSAQALQASRGILLRLRYWEPLFKSRFQEQIPKIRTTVASEWQRQANEHESFRAVPSVLNQSFWMAECTLCQHALIQPGQPIAIRDREQLLKLDGVSSVAPIFNLEEFPALLLAPLESQGTVLGFLVFQQNQTHKWQPEEIELVKLVGAQVSTAIIQTETLRQVQALVDKRTAELQQSLSIQAKLYERTRQQLEQLRRLNQLKDEFLSTVSHELRTPLTSMTMAIRMLRQNGLTSDRSERYLDILEQQCAQEANLINDLLALQELESKQVTIQPEEIDLKALVKESADVFNQKWSAKGLVLDLNLPQKSLKLYSDRDSLLRVLLELLTNAGKYSDPNTHIHLSATYQADQPISKVVLTLCNTG